MKRVILPNKYVGEAISITFDFTSSLVQSDSLTGTPTCAVTPYLGSDGGAAAMVSGTATRSGNVVRQQIINGVAGVTYTVMCAASTVLGNSIRLQGFLTVLPSQP